MAQTYICTATRLRVRGVRQLPAFLRASSAAAAAAKRTPGNAGTRVLGVPPLLTFSTMSVWESREAMQEFARSPEHRLCMVNMPAWARRGKFVTFTTETPRPGWRLAGRKLRDPDAVWTPQGQTRRPTA
jgi:hypothetical protein